MIPPSEVRELTFKDYIDIVLRRSWIAISCVVLISSFTAFKSFSTPKEYLTYVKLLFKRELPRVTGREDVIYRGGVPVRSDQLNFLTSRAVAERVIKKLNLVSDEDFIGVSDPEKRLIEMVTMDTPPIKSGEASNLILLFIRGRDPIKITKIINTWAEEFLVVDVESRIMTAKYGIGWLREQLDSTLKKLEAAEKKLIEFTKINRIESMRETGEGREGLIENLKGQKSNLEKQIIETSRKYGAKHPKMLDLESERQAIEQKYREEQDKVFSLQEKSLEYKILKREVDTYKNIYNDFVNRIKELEISKEMVTSNVQIIDLAQIPSVPVKPQPAKDITKGIVLSLILGIGLCYFLEYSDSTLKSSEDVEFYTKMPFLGYIPSAKREVKRTENKDLIAFFKPYSGVGESFRNLRVSLIFSFPEDRPLHAIMVTSSVAREGKSFISLNLGITFAQTKEDTLVIDADMRKGRLAQALDIKTRYGLSSLLAGMCSLKEAVIATSIPNLYMISAGPATPNPAELLSSNKFMNILEEAKGKFKRIVIDGPPVMGVSDTVLLGDKCDGVVFVIKTASTSVKLITEVRKILGKKIKIIGAVLNNLRVESDRYYSYYHYYHYSYNPPKKT